LKEQEAVAKLVTPVFNGSDCKNVGNQFLSRRYFVNAHVRAFVVVGPDPLCYVMMCLLNAIDNALILPCMPTRFTTARNIVFLQPLSRLDLLDRYFAPIRSILHLINDVSRSVINPDTFLSALLLDDPALTPDDPL